MNTLELTEALQRLEQDGETAIAKSAGKELDNLIARNAELEAENNNLRDDLMATASYLCKELSKNRSGNHSGNLINCKGGICVSTRALLSPKAGE